MKFQTFIFFALTLYSCSAQTKNEGLKSVKFTKQDSTFIYENFLYYDKDTREYNDADERWISEYWQENNDSAYFYYEKAVSIRDIPPDLKMIFASYFYNKKGDNSLIETILEEDMTQGELKNVFNIMSSYGIPFSEFGIQKETIETCCPDIGYN